MAIIELEHVSRHYGAEPNLVKALDDISLGVEAGSFAAVVGASGSGKTTMLNLIGGLDIPTRGIVRVDGKRLAGMSDRERTIFRRRKIGFVFQSYNLVPILNVAENILLPADLDGDKPDPAYLGELLDLLGLSEKLERMPRQLSGGEQQRVAIARALITKPAVLLADEPTGNLDSRNGEQVMELFKRANFRYGQTILMITHNAALAALADTVIAVEDGRLKESGWLP